MTTAELTLPNHSLPTADPRLDAIRAKVERGERLSLDDGMVLYETPDLWGVFELADLVRDRLHPGVAYRRGEHAGACRKFHKERAGARGLRRALSDRPTLR